MNKNEPIPALLSDLQKVNQQKIIKIRFRKVEKKGYSLYLDMWYEGKREYQFLKLYVLGKRHSYYQDKENIKLAISIRDKKELELIQDEAGFELKSWKTKANFTEYYKIISDKTQREIATWKSSFKHIDRFTNGHVRFRDIDEKFCVEYRDYLLSKISVNSAHLYFSKFKACLKQAVKDKILVKSPAVDITIKRIDTERAFLSLDEIQTLIKTPCKNKDLKNAFLFSCFTGLRLSDIQNLTYDDINEGYVYIQQKKTKDTVRIKLNEDAKEIIERQKKNRFSDNTVFQLKSYSKFRNDLKHWVKKSGIRKHITFHSGRHTFATMCLTYDVDLFTVSKLLGHRNIKTTQIYAKLIDKKKDEAIEKLPRIL